MSVLNYVPRVNLCHTCLKCLTCLRVFVPLVRFFIFLSASRALIFYLPSFFYAPSFFKCLMCRAFIILRAYILFMHMLIKVTQINELTYDRISLLLLSSVIYQHLSNIFTSIKLVSYSA